METKRSESASAFRPRPLCYTPLFSFPPQTRSHSHALTLTHGHSLPPAMYHSRPSGMMVALPHPYLSTELMIVDLVWPRAPQPTASSEPRKWESLRPAGSEVCVLPPIPACSSLSVGGCVALQRVPCYLNAASYDPRASCGGLHVCFVASCPSLLRSGLSGLDELGSFAVWSRDKRAIQHVLFERAF